MVLNERTMKLGRKAELEQQQAQYRIDIDSAVKSLREHFEPMDIDCTYVDNIVPERVQLWVNTIKRVKKLLDRVNAELKKLKAELGEE